MPPPRPRAPDRAVLYLRQSTYREESVSLAQQESVCRDYAARRGFIVVGVCSDPGVSASKTRLARRKGVQEALEMLDAKTADVLVCWKGSRVARNRLDAELARERAESAGGRIESATEPNEMSAAGRLATGLFAEVDAFQARQIGEDWRLTHARRRSAGLPAQGGRRYGYDRVCNEVGRVTGYTVNEDEASVLRWCYDRVIEGRGATWIAGELNRRGHPNPVGRPWRTERIFALLDSGFAAGLLVHHPRDASNRKVGEATYHDGAHPPIISRRTWDAYLLARRARAGTPPRSVEPRYPLTGLAVCGDCGESMWAARSKYGGAGHTLICGRWQRTRQGRCVTIARHRAEAAVLAWLGEQVADIERAADADTVVRNRLARARRAAKDAARDVADIDRKIERLNRAWLDGTVPDAGYASTRDGLIAERDEAVRRADTAELAASRRALPTRSTAAGLLEQWDELPVTVRRNLLRDLIARVVIHPPEQRGGRAGVEVVPVWDA